MLTFSRLYRQYGIRKITDFLAVRKGEIANFGFPAFSAYHFASFDLDIFAPDQNASYFTTTKKRIPVVDLFNPVSKKGAILREANYKAVFDTLKKTQPKFKHYAVFKNTNSIRNIIFKKNIPVIYNHAVQNAILNYLQHQMVPYYIWYNQTASVYKYADKIITAGYKDINIAPELKEANLPVDKDIEKAVNAALKDERVHYYMVNIDHEIPTYTELVTYKEKTFNTAALHIFDTPFKLWLLDIVKWIDPNTRASSLLKYVTDNNALDFTFILRYGENFVLLNLGYLNKLIRTLDNPDGYQPNKVIKSLLAMVEIMVNSAVVEETISDSEEKEEVTSAKTTLSRVERVVKLIETNKKIAKAETAEVEVDPVAEVYKDYDPLSKSVIKLKTFLKENKNAANKANVKAIRQIITKQEKGDIKTPYGKPLKEMITIKDEELDIKEEEVTIPDKEPIIDKKITKSTITPLDRKYIRDVMAKDLVSSIYHIQNSGVLVEEHKIETETSVTGEAEIHTIKLRPIDGKPSTIKIKLPKINEEGEFTIAGTTYRLRKQKTDLPIRKIAANAVGLTSYYGKLFVYRSPYKKDDIGYWIMNQLSKMSNEGTIKNLLLADVFYYEDNLPTLYTRISKYIKSFHYQGDILFFDYENREDLLKDTKLDIKKVENKRYVLVGLSSNKQPILMDKEGNVYYYGDGINDNKGSFYQYLGIDDMDAPIEKSFLRLFSSYVPLGMVMCYYLGIDGLLKITKAKYKKLDKKTKTPKLPDEWDIVFADTRLRLNRQDKEASLLLAGLQAYEKHLKTTPFDHLNDKDVISQLLIYKGFSSKHIKEFHILDDLFIDPITKSVLKRIKEPTTFKALLLRANELLLTDYTETEQELERLFKEGKDTLLIKGYERVPGIVYRELANAIKQYHYKNMFGNAKVEMNFLDAWNTITTDNSKVLVTNLNPIETLKQKEDVTFLGVGGRSKETMSKDTRGYRITDIGLFSEAVKDSGDVGINAYLAANPKIDNLRGIRTKFDFDKDGAPSIFSTSALLSVGADRDDQRYAL